MPKNKNKFLNIIKEREDLTSSAPQYFVDQLEKVQNKTYDDLLSFIKELDAKGGKALEASSFNIKMANSLRYDTRKWLKKNGYYESLTAFGKKYQDVILKSRQYYDSMGLDGAFTARDLDTLAKLKMDDLNFLVSRDQDVINATYQEVINSIYSKSDWRGLAARLKSLHTDTVLSSGAKLNGLLKKYNSTYAFTAFSGFDRRIQTIKAEQYGMDLFYYSGSLLTDSREFCVNRVGKVFSKKEIDSWNKMGPWNGKAAGRDVWVFLGGWNCGHILSPVTEEFAKELGYGTPQTAGGKFKPAKSVSEAEKRLNSKLKFNKAIPEKERIKIANKILEENNYLMSNYSKLKNVKIGEYEIGLVNLNDARMAGYYDIENRSMFIRADMFNKKSVDFSRAAISKNGSTCFNYQDIYRHEFAHAIENQLLDEDMIFAMRDEVFDYTDNQIKNDISKYAITEPEEFAEMFNLFVSNKKTRFSTFKEMFKIIKGF